jgi:crossover junction endodeoxyribonuclease RuvC
MDPAAVSPVVPSSDGVPVGVPGVVVVPAEGPSLRLLALDLSLTSSGWALPDGEVVASGTLRPGSKLSGAARLAWVCDRVVELVGEGDERVSLVLLEGYSFGSQGRATFSIGELGGAVRMTLFRLGVPFVEVPPAVLKKFAVGSGQASKDEVLLAAARRGGDMFVGSSNDEADAFWLLVAGYAAAAARSVSVVPLLRMPAVQVAALEQVEWGPLVGVLAGAGGGLSAG